jgi:hypothetical protein
METLHKVTKRLNSSLNGGNRPSRHRARAGMDLLILGMGWTRPREGRTCTALLKIHVYKFRRKDRVLRASDVANRPTLLDPPLKTINLNTLVAVMVIFEPRSPEKSRTFIPLNNSLSYSQLYKQVNENTLLEIKVFGSRGKIRFPSHYIFKCHKRPQKV